MSVLDFDHWAVILCFFAACVFLALLGLYWKRLRLKDEDEDERKAAQIREKQEKVYDPE